MPEKKSAADFGFDPGVLPEELESLVTQLEQNDSEGSYYKEAEHYWEDACKEEFEEANSFIAHAIKNFRLRFRDDFADMDDDTDATEEG